MYHHVAINVLSLLQNLSNHTKNDRKLEEEFQKIVKKFQIEYEELVDIYNKMVLFQFDINKIGGLTEFEKSNITWLKSELELLYVTYQFCQRQGLNIASISKYISKEQLQLFPKTESQLQNTYYKLKNQDISFENIVKQKPGRKRKNETVKQLQVEEKQENNLNTHSEQTEHNLVTVVSGIVRNFETIHEYSENQDHELQQFMEGIYKLSSMAAEGIQDKKDTNDLEGELQDLRAQNERLQRENQEFVTDIKELVNHMIHFITSSDMDQIRTLPYFVKMCKQDLHKLGLYHTQESKMKIMVDRSGQVMTVTQ